MPYRFTIHDGAGVKAAPGVRLQDGARSFLLRDPAGNPVPNADIRMTVAYGGGTFLVPDGAGGEKRAHLVERTTDAAGVVPLPPFLMGPVEGQNGITVQSSFATLETEVRGTFESTRIRVLAPLGTDVDQIAGRRVEVRVVVEDTGYGDGPVRGLAVEVETTRGGATFDAGSGAPGCYAIVRTGDDGQVALQLDLARRAETVTVRFLPLWERRIPAADIVLNVRSPAFLTYGHPTIDPIPLWSLSVPQRHEVSDSPDATISPDDSDIHGLFTHAEEPGRRAEIIPPVSVDRYMVSSFFAYPAATGTYQVRVRLPDYPDSPPLVHTGSAQDPRIGHVPRTHTPGPLGRDYVHSWGGGNKDPGHLLSVRLLGGYHQYLGPNAETQGPMHVEVTVEPPQGVRRLVEARFRFKVRTSPGNSSVDDPPNGLLPGQIAEPGTNQWADEVTLAVPGNPGVQNVGVLFRSNSDNWDHVIEITAEVTMEDEDTNGNLVQWDADSTILLRAAVLQPRLYLTVQHGNDIVPMLEGGIRPVTLFERDGSQRAVNPSDAFFVEMRCHDIGQTVECEVRSPGLRRIQLARVSVSSEFALYRSNPCYVSLDDQRAGVAAPVAPAGSEILSGTPGAMLEARIVSQMPGNDDDVVYTTGRRPVASFQLVETGDHDRTDLPVPPALHVRVRDDATWPVTKTTTGHEVTLAGWVQDAVAEISGVLPTAVEVGGTAFSLTHAAGVATLGRPLAWKGDWTATVSVDPGVQVIRVAVENALGTRTERFFEVTLVQSANDFTAPDGYTAHVRPVGRVLPHPVPFLAYAFTQGTALPQGVVAPTSHGATLRTLEPGPSANEVSAAALSMRPRPTSALAYASPPVLCVRDDLAPPSGSTLPTNVLRAHLGGRLEWQTADLPHADGPVAVANRRIQRHLVLDLLRKDAAGAWVDADHVVAGDVVTVRGRAHPREGGASARLEICDFGGLGAPGSDRAFDVMLTADASGELRLDAYMDAAFAFHNATEIELVTALDPPASPPPLRVAGPGRLRLTAGSDVALADVAVFVRPGRHAASPPVDQEPLRNPFGRLGALASVVPGTGEVVLEEVDHLIRSRGLASSFERTYRSANDYAGPLGHGWNASWNTFIWKESADEVRLFRGDGRVVPFRRLPSGGFETVAGMYARLEEHSGFFRLRTPGGVLLTYVASHPANPALFELVAYEDRFRNRQTTRRAVTGNVTHVRDTLGRTFQLVLDPVSRRLSSLSDHAGNETRYAYFPAGSTDGAEGNLAFVESPEAKHSLAAAATRRKLGYTYFPAADKHRLRSIQDPQGVASNLAPLVEMTWHATGHVATQHYGYGDYVFTPDPSGGPLTWQDRKGQDRTVEFHPAAGDGFARRPSRTRLTANGETIEHAYQYNAAGELTRHELPEGNVHRFEYDDAAGDVRDRGNLRAVIREPGTSGRPTIVATQAAYDPATGAGGAPTYRNATELRRTYTYEPGLQIVKTFTDELGRVTTFGFSGGAVVSETRPRVTRGGASHTAQSLVYQFRHNRWGQILYAIDPAGVVTRYRYFPESDPGGRSDPAARAADDEAGGYRAEITADAPPPAGNPAPTTRDPLLATARPVTESYTYDERGHQTSIVDGGGGTTAFTYNALGDVLRVVGPCGETTEHTFDVNGRSATTVRNITDIARPAYLPASSAILPMPVTDSITFDRRGLPVEAVVDVGGLNLETTWTYDPNDNVEYENSPIANRASSPHPFARTRYEYDEADRLRIETQAAGSANDLVRNFEYDRNGNPTLEALPGGRRRVTAYDAFDRQIGQADALGTEFQTHLDAVGNVVRVVVRGNPGTTPGQMEVLQDQYRYFDEADRLLAVKERAFELVPDGTGWREEPMGRGFRLTFHMYDVGGNPVKTGDRLGLVTDLTYDGHGLPVSSSDSRGTSGTMSYDGLGNPLTIAQSDPVGTVTVTRQYDASGRPTAELKGAQVVRRVFYDSLGRPRFRENGVGNWTGVEYDAAGRRVTLLRSHHDRGRRLNPDATTNSAFPTFSSTTVYDENSNVREVTDFGGKTIADLLYDDRNLVIRRILPDDSFDINGTVRDDNPNLETYLYTYQTNGSLDVITDPTGLEIHHFHDLAGRLVRREIRQGTAATLQGTTLEEYAYDGLGRLLVASDDNGITGKAATIRQRYDSLGGVTRSEQSDDLTGTAVTRTVTAGYSPQGQHTTLQYPNGGPQIFTPRNAYGAVERVVDRTNSRTLADYGWDGRHFSYRRHANGLSLGFGYDADKAILEVRTYTGTNFLDDSNLVVGHRYAYDRAGRVVRDKDLGKNRITRVYHDSLDRLAATEDGYIPGDPSSIPDIVTDSVLDNAGNPLFTETVKVSRRLPNGQLRGVRLFHALSHFNDANQVGQREIVRDPIGAPPTTAIEQYHYDRRGNVIRDGVDTYRYDYKNRLIGMSGPSGTHVFHYDALDRRIRKNDVEYTYWRHDVIQERFASPQISWTKRYFYGARPGELVAYSTDFGGTEQWYHAHENRAGQIEFMSDASGGISEIYVSDAEGRPTEVDENGDPLAVTATTGNRLRRRGHYHDREIGITFVGSRVLSARLGRFLQRDPGGALRSPRYMGNGYVYALNNPIQFEESGDGGGAYTSASVPTESLAAIAGESAGKSFLAGLGLMLVVVAVSFVPVIGPYIALTAMTVGLGAAMISRAGEIREMGEDVEFWPLIGAAAGDLVGISAFIESYTGRRIGSGMALSDRDRAAHFGMGLGSLATLVFGPKVFRWGVSRAMRLRGDGSEPVEVELLAVHMRSTEQADGSGHLMIRMTFRDGRQFVLDRVSADRMFFREPGTGWRLRLGGPGTRDWADPVAQWGRTWFRARYVISHFRAQRALWDFHPGARVIEGWNWRQPFAPIRNCAALPGELGIGLRAPLLPDVRLTVFVNGLAYSGWGAAAGMIGVAKSTRQTSDID